MELYIETAVARKNSITDIAKCFFCCMLPLVLGTYLVMLVLALKNSSFLVLSLVACALLYYLSFKIFTRFNIEWEYTLVQDEIRFSKVINKSKRKELFTIPLSKVSALVGCDSTEYSVTLRRFNGKKYNFTSQTKAPNYLLQATDKKGERVLIIFEPNDKMLENFKTTLRGKIQG